MDFHFQDFDESNCKRIRRGNPVISFSKKGTITFNKTLCGLIGLKHGNRVKFRLTSEGEWYVYKTTDDNGFCVRGYGEKNVNMIMNSSSLVRRVVKENSCSFPVSKKPLKSDDGKELYFILTQKPIKNDPY